MKRLGTSESPGRPGSDAELRVAGVPIRMLWCPPGEFVMGTPAGEPARMSCETQHPVVLTSGFWMSDTPATNRLWRAIMGPDAGPAQGDEPDDIPIYGVTWDEAMRFCEQLGSASHEAGALEEGWRITLPSEAQWEYACRAGTETRWYFGNTEDDLPRHAWYRANSGLRAHAVGQKEPNPWGFHDLYGNVSEWCLDSFYPFDRERAVDPIGRDANDVRMHRGGCFIEHPITCRSGSRAVAMKEDPDRPIIGVRIVCTT